MLSREPKASQWSGTLGIPGVARVTTWKLSVLCATAQLVLRMEARTNQCPCPSSHSGARHPSSACCATEAEPPPCQNYPTMKGQFRKGLTKTENHQRSQCGSTSPAHKESVLSQLLAWPLQGTDWALLWPRRAVLQFWHSTPGTVNPWWTYRPQWPWFSTIFLQVKGLFLFLV